MKPVYIFTCALALLSLTAHASPADAHPEPLTLSPRHSVARITPAGDTGIITAQPEGTLIDPLYCSSEKTYLIYSQAVASTSDNNGYAGKMVRTDKAVYINNLVSEFDRNVNYWVKGDIESDGTVTFKFPQHVHHSDATLSTAATDIYIARLTPSLSDNTVKLAINEADCDLRMKWDGDRLVQIMPENTDSKLKSYSGIVGMANAKGEFIGYGEQGIAYKIIDDKILTPPAALKSSQYMLTYKKGDNTPKSTVITIGTEGDNVWFQGLNTFIPEAWVKGTINDGRITIPTTFTGVTLNCLTYITGLTDDLKAFTTGLSILKTEEGYAAENVIFTSIGNEIIQLHDNRIMFDAVMTPYNEGSKTPATPVIDDGDEGSEPWTEEEGMGALCFMLDPVDTDGNPLDQSKLYYNIFRNGEPYTLTAGDYGLENDITDIPYTFNGDYIYNIDGYIMFFFLHDMDTIGVRALYKNGDKTTCSEIATHTFKQNSLTAPTDENKIVAVEYFNLNGQKVAAHAKGLCIKLTRYADGSSTASKSVCP